VVTFALATDDIRRSQWVSRAFGRVKSSYLSEKRRIAPKQSLLGTPVPVARKEPIAIATSSELQACPKRARYPSGST
jgi:hypothetical protein